MHVHVYVCVLETKGTMYVHAESKGPYEGYSGVGGVCIFDLLSLVPWLAAL